SVTHTTLHLSDLLHRPTPIASLFLLFFFCCYGDNRNLHSFPTRRSSDLEVELKTMRQVLQSNGGESVAELPTHTEEIKVGGELRSEEHTSELQSRSDLVCRLLLEKKNTK